MASQTGPDLDDAQVAIEELMDDSCIIYHTLDEAEELDLLTGVITAPLGSELYNALSVGVGGRSLADSEGLGGKCKITPSSQDLLPEQDEEAGGDIAVVRFLKFTIPIDAPPIPKGALVKFTSSRRDPRLTDTLYAVFEILNSTFAVQQKMIVERRTYSTSEAE